MSTAHGAPFVCISGMRACVRALHPPDHSLLFTD